MATVLKFFQPLLVLLVPYVRLVGSPFFLVLHAMSCATFISQLTLNRRFSTYAQVLMSVANAGAGIAVTSICLAQPMNAIFESDFWLPVYLGTTALTIILDLELPTFLKVTIDAISRSYGLVACLSVLRLKSLVGKSALALLASSSGGIIFNSIFHKVNSWNLAACSFGIAIANSALRIFSVEQSQALVILVLVPLFLLGQYFSVLFPPAEPERKARVTKTPSVSNVREKPATPSSTRRRQTRSSADKDE